MLKIFIIIIAIYFSALAIVYFKQQSLVYHPDPLRPLPQDYNLSGFKVVEIPSHDGLKLYGWWHPPKESRETLVWFHGNAGSLDFRSSRLPYYTEKGYGLLISSYRYNAGAGGHASEPLIIKDSIRVTQWLNEAKSIPYNQMILYGESIGSGVVSAIAQKIRQKEITPKAIILEAPFSSVLDVASEMFWFFPIKLLLKDTWLSHERIKDIKIPKLIIHGTQDKVTNIKYGRKLFDHVPEPKDFITIEGGGHTNLYDHGAAQKIIQWIEKL